MKFHKFVVGLALLFHHATGFSFPDFSQPFLVLNEVFYQGGTSTSGVCNGEDYIEFKNLAPFTLNLNSFELDFFFGNFVGRVDNPSARDIFIGPGKLLLICRTLNGYDGQSPGQVSFVVDIVSGETDDPNSTNTVSLFTRSTRSQEKVLVSSTGPLPEGDETTSYQRQDNGTYRLAAPTPGRVNFSQGDPSAAAPDIVDPAILTGTIATIGTTIATIGTTIGNLFVNLLTQAFVVVNEVADQGAGSTSGVCNGEDYIELKNLSPSTDFNLNGFVLAVVGTSGLRSEVITSNEVIGAGELLLFCRFVPDITGGRKLGTGGFTFSFDVEPKDKVILSNPEGDVVSITDELPEGDGTTSLQRTALGFYLNALKTPNADSSVQGDPHFKAWRGHHYDFHGACDLIFLHSKEFESGLGLDLHIRTTIRGYMSYISSAVIRIGADVLEVESQGVYYFNGAANAELPTEFAGFEFLHTQPTDKQHVFEVHLGGRERVKLKTYKDFVSVVIEQGLSKHFGKSVGLMGDFRMGHMIARDGTTILDDAIVFGQEWQVLDTEPTLFQTTRFPQHPEKCTMPTPKATSILRRRLSETTSVDELAAEKACEHWGEQGKDDCVFDVLTTGDLEMAAVGAY